MAIWVYFLMTFIESTFIPIPAEITLIPAGYLASKNEMHLGLLLLTSVIGTMGGAYFNYWIAQRYGRHLILKYGHYFLMNEKKLQKLENYFSNHGVISTFTGRLIPGLRHYISFSGRSCPYDIKLFLAYTAIGGSIWISVLLGVGYLIGTNEHLVKHYVVMLKVGGIIFAALVILGYMLHIRRKNKLKE